MRISRVVCTECPSSAPTIGKLAPLRTSARSRMSQVVQPDVGAARCDSEIREHGAQLPLGRRLEHRSSRRTSRARTGSGTRCSRFCLVERAGFTQTAFFQSMVCERTRRPRRSRLPVNSASAMVNAALRRSWLQQARLGLVHLHGVEIGLRWPSPRRSSSRRRVHVDEPGALRPNQEARQGRKDPVRLRLGLLADARMPKLDVVRPDLARRQVAEARRINRSHAHRSGRGPRRRVSSMTPATSATTR